MFTNVGVVVHRVPEIIGIDSSCPCLGRGEGSFVADDLSILTTQIVFVAVKNAFMFIRRKWQHEPVDS